LNKALEDYPQAVNIFSFSPVQLYPGISSSGKPISDRARRGMQSKYTIIRQEFESAGYCFNASGIQVLPNTFLPHQLLYAIPAAKSRSILMDIFFVAYFEKGLNIGLAPTLETILQENHSPDLPEHIPSEEILFSAHPNAIENQEYWKSESNVVPSFRIQGNLLNGLISPEQWKKFLKKSCIVS
jgi:hypothetical protein